MTFIKILVGYHCAFALYGFSRGYRSIPNDFIRITYNLKKEEIPSHSLKVYMGFSNITPYGMPILNIPKVYNLFNRLRVVSYGLDRNLYYNSYEERIGVCDDTL